MIQEKEYPRSRQTLSSVIILFTLIVIGAFIFRTQFHFNPAVLENINLRPTPEKVKTAAQLAAINFFKPLPEGAAPLTPAETFGPQNLSDKIDGKAELYLSAGFKRLVSQRYSIDRNTDLWVEAFVYDMNNSQNAFSVFSTQRRKGALPLDLSKNAYRTSNALFFTRGPYYVEMIASKAFEDLPAPLMGMAETFIANTPSEAPAKTENPSAFFPSEGQIKDSVSLIAANAFGFEGFDKIYTAEYRLRDQIFMAYLSHRKDLPKAKEMVSAYAAFLLAFGGKEVRKKIPIPKARILEVLGTYEIIFSHGPFLAGVREAPSLETAEVLAQRLYEKLKEVVP